MKASHLVTRILFVGLTILGLFIHVLTFVGYDPRELSLGLWWGLHFASALSLILGLVTFGLKKPVSPLASTWSPDKVLALCFVLFMVYAAFNFGFTGIVLLHNASPAIVDGHYAFGSHGMFRPISKEEYMKYMVYEARLHSGHWMAFFLFALVALR